MKRFFTIINVTFAIIFTSCKKETVPDPVADFTFEVQNQYAPATVQFTNASINATSFQWSFGDGSSSTEKNVNHLYSMDGVYQVVLTVSNSDGKTNTVNKSITINRKPAEPPVINFTYSGNSSFAPCFVSFTNSTTNAISYLWSFGDGVSSTDKNPKHLYSNGGSFNVILNATNSDGISTSITKQVIVSNKPSKAKITKVTVSYMNFIDPSTGGGWDMTSGPDPYYVVSDYPSGTTYYTSGYISDIVAANIPLGFANYTISLSNVDKQYAVSIYDDDGIWGNQFIGGYYFKFRDYMPTDGSSYPSTIILENSTNNVKLRLNIGWLP